MDCGPCTGSQQPDPGPEVLSSHSQTNAGVPLSSKRTLGAYLTSLCPSFLACLGITTLTS